MIIGLLMLSQVNGIQYSKGGKSMMEKLNEIYAKFEAYFKANPRYAFYLVGVVLLIMGIGSILGKNWAIDPANSNQRLWYNFIGRKWFGIITGLTFILGAIAAFLAGLSWK